jgi:hypothetical protein
MTFAMSSPEFEARSVHKRDKSTLGCATTRRWEVWVRIPNIPPKVL